jgi:predicted nucleic-acid-binding Zn-ribbon protein
MLKHQCPKCGSDIGYKWNYSIYSKGYQCPKCKTQFETTIVLTLTMFLSFLIGLTLTDYISPFVFSYNNYPQVTKGVITFISIISVWLVLSTLLPIKLRIRKKKTKK